MDAARHATLEQRKIPIIEAAVQELLHTDGYISAIRLANGSVVAVDAMFNRPAFRQHCEVPVELGCTLTEQGYLRADGFGKTNVQGVFVAGDNSSMMRSVAAAAAAAIKQAPGSIKTLQRNVFDNGHQLRSLKKREACLPLFNI